MKLPEIAVKNPIFILMVFLAILIFGLVSRTMIPVDVLPDIEMPMMTVVTVYPGASAEEVEQEVTKQLEKTLAGVNDLESIKSTSKENVSLISLEFNQNSDLNECANSARDALELIKQKLPSGVENPFIYRVNSSMMPVLIYAVEAEASYLGIDNIIENNISNRLKNLPGVASILVIAAPEREIKIEVDPYQLQAYQLSVAQIAQVLELESVSIPGGNVKLGGYDLSVQVPADFATVAEIEQVVLTSFNGKIVRVGDVATVVDGFREKDIQCRSMQREAVVMMVQKQSGSNTLEVASAVKAEIAEINQVLPSDVQVNQVLDSSELVSHSIDNLSKTIFWASLFVILVVFFFMREFKSSLIVILTIPFSLITAFIFMFIADYSVNIFSLMSLAIAIGMVVDNTIVVFENIKSHIENGERPAQAAIFGTSEMGMAITASSLTTIAVFIPMIFLEGIVGVLFKQLAILTSVTILASLFTALTLTPMLASLFLKNKRQQKSKNSFFKFSENIFARTEQAYSRFLATALSYRKSIIGGIGLLFLLALYLGLQSGSNYIPEFDAGDLNALIKLEVGTSVEKTQEISRQVEQIFFDEVPELRALYSINGQTEESLLATMGFEEGTNCATIGGKLILPDDRDYTAQEIAAKIRPQIEQIPEIVEFRVAGGSLLGMALLGNKRDIEINIMGNNYDSINGLARQIEELFAQQTYLHEVGTTIDNGKLELKINVDKERASTLGLNSGMIALAVRQSIYGAEAGELVDAGENYQISVRYAAEYRNEIGQLENLMLSSVTGQMVPLSAVATLSQGYGPLEIQHESQQRLVKVYADAYETSLGEAVAQVEQQLAQLEIPEDLVIEMGGKVADKDESFNSLYLLFFLGLAMVYMVMASQFGSFMDPLIIMFAVPLSIIGVVIAFLLTGESLSVVTFIGLIMLIGIVVNNGIVLVDYINLLRARGNKLVTAITEAGKSRLRPVMMTALTTILGMVPLAFSSGMGSEMWKPLGITVIGGLLVATLITLIFIPVLYLSFHRRDLLKEGEE
ncbi:MAG: efflux RND transporter permease subunit [Candidatus Cloacimonadales bacterium]